MLPRSADQDSAPSSRPLRLVHESACEPSWPVRINAKTFARPVKEGVSEIESCYWKLCAATLLAYRELLPENKAMRKQDM